MPVSGWKKAVGAGAAFVLISAGLWRYDRAHAGVPSFRAWGALTGKAHGGQHAQINGTSLYYETFGEGPPVLVLHGGGGTLESMRHQIMNLARDHMVVAPDSRGQGRSAPVPGALHYAVMADDMIGLMDHLHIARADVVGWSDGGILGLDMAMRRPERVGRLVAIGANFDSAGLVSTDNPASPDNPGFADDRDNYRRLSPTPDNWPHLYAQVTQLWRTEPHYTAAELGRIRSPTLIIAGEQDAVRREHTDALARAIPGAVELIVPKAGHTVPVRKPGVVNAAIRAFFANHPGERP